MRKRVLTLFLAAVAVGTLNLFSQNMSNIVVTAQALPQEESPQSVVANA